MDKKEEKVQLTKESHIEFLNKIIELKMQERDMALDRYRRADNDIESNEDFMILGKVNISYLNAAADASSSLSEIARDMGKILYKEDNPGNNVTVNFNEEKKRLLAEEVKKSLEEERARRIEERKNKALPPSL